MARQTDLENRKKRTTTIILTKEAYLVLRNIRKQSNIFDFSKWISNKLLSDFSGKIDKEELHLRELTRLQNEYKLICDEYEHKIAIQANLYHDEKTRKLDKNKVIDGPFTAK